jgi:heptaprenyl diphosphate synthase
MYAGAVLGQNGECDARRMARIGFDIGMCFQILDDCMDYRADKDVAKKTVRHDLAQGVVTLPLIYALLENPLLKARLKSRRLAAAEIPAVLAEVCRAGGVRHALDVAEKYFKRADRRIANLEDADKRRILGDVLEKIRMNAGM